MSLTHDVHSMNISGSTIFHATQDHACHSFNHDQHRPRPNMSQILPRLFTWEGDAVQVRHGLMLVGQSYGAKSCLLRCLAASLGLLHAKGLLSENE